MTAEAPPTSDTEATAPPQPEPQLANLARPEKVAPAPVPVVTSEPAPPPANSSARVTLGEVQLSGGTIDRDSVKQALELTANQVRTCYAREVADAPTLSGRITATWTIERDGSAKKVKASAGVTQTVSGCVGDAIRGTQFAKPEKGTITASLAFDFAPK